MSSLPQGWHSLNGPVKKTAAGKMQDSTTAVSAVRKKWNSPQSVEVNKTMLPTLRKGSLPSVPNRMQNKVSVAFKSQSAKAGTGTNFKSQLPENAACSAKVKESQAELTSLKKELATVKAENAVIKARLRRIDDENSQKSRIIEKLQAEKKAEVMSIRRNKDTENATLLRQKCLRLESALKEKDLSMKKMVAEIKSVKEEELKDLVEKYHKQLGVSNGLGSDFFKNHKILQSNSGNKTATSRQAGRTNIRDQATKSEVQKLRDMLHKMEVENKNLISQLKEKDQEIRRLKLQFQRQTSKPSSSSQSSLPAVASRLSQPDIRSAVPASRRVPASGTAVGSRQQVTREPSSHMKNKVTVRPASTAIPGKTVVQQRQQVRASVPKSVHRPGESTFTVTRAQGVPKCKPPNSRTRPPAKVVAGPTNLDMETKVQNMRENIAARKIQQGWRHHRKMMNEGASEEKRAVIALCSELKKNKVRKCRLEFFSQTSSGSMELSKDDEEKLAEELKSAFDSIYKDNEGTNNPVPEGS